MVLITLKFTYPNALSWNYILLFFMGVAVYLMVLGLLMSIILSCSLFGFLYRDIESWKVKSLIWMTWYYLWTGIVFIYFVKGTVIYFDEDLATTLPVKNNDYLHYRSDHIDMLVVAAILMIICSAVNLIFHLMWEKEIKRYLSKVIYRHELRKEISLRFLTKSFTFNLI